LAIKLEKSAAVYQLNQETAYNFRISKTQDRYIIDPLSIFRQIIGDLKIKEPRAKIAWRFHITVAQMIRRTCLILRKDSGLNRVVLSGGVFQNNLLLKLVLDLLYKDKFLVLTHQKLSCNDSGISLGQALIANFSPPR
jgi:hydrogenase maturation protein HypF